jgi:branched-chain amino acid transport system permease protein
MSAYLPCGVYMESYEAEQKWWRTWFIKSKMIVMIVALLALPKLVGGEWLSVAYNINYYILAGLGVQLLVGYCGQITLGHAAFVAVGAYTSALTVLFFPFPQFIIDAGLAYPISIIFAGLAAGTWSVLFGLPSARVKGFYLIMTTMAAQWITVPLVITQYVARIGERGQAFPVPEGTFKIGPWEIVGDERIYYLSLVLVLVSLLAMGNMLRSKLGRAWVAIRDNDIAAETMGVNIVAYKLLAFFVAGFFAGVAGAYYICSLYFVSPEHYTWFYSLLWVGIILIGGVGSIQGLVFGSIFVVMVFKLLELGVLSLSGVLMAYNPQLGWVTTKIIFFKESAFGLAIIFFLMYEPNGLAYRYWQLKNYFNLWPFSYTGKGA